MLSSLRIGLRDANNTCRTNAFESDTHFVKRNGCDEMLTNIRASPFDLCDCLFLFLFVCFQGNTPQQLAMKSSDNELAKFLQSKNFINAFCIDA